MTKDEIERINRFAPAEVAPWRLFPKLIRYGSDLPGDDSIDVWVLSSKPANDTGAERD